ncbi:MAG: hypothetical protein VX768_16000 [Planctomycetota bacterium]|nr:hypothetical protein [Planctomycetota bacterium]
MTGKKRIIKFTCPRCHATAKAFAEADDGKKAKKQKKDCFRCGAKMTALADDLEPATPAQRVVEENPEKTVEGRPHAPVSVPSETDTQGSTPGESQKTNKTGASEVPPDSVERGSPDAFSSHSQDVSADSFGVVVTDTSYSVGRVEVNTIRISDHVPSHSSDGKTADDGGEQTPGPSPGSNENPMPLTDSQLSTASRQENTPGEEGADTAVPRDSQRTPVDDATGEQTTGQQTTGHSAELDQPSGSSHRRESSVSKGDDSANDDSANNEKSSANGVEPEDGRNGNAELLDADLAVDGRPWSSDQTKNPSSPPSQPDADQSEAATPREVRSAPKEVPVGNRLKLTHDNENKWLVEVLFFTRCSEFVLRCLLAALFTGLGLTFLLGTSTVAFYFGFLVLLPGLLVLAVAGADITTETIAGCRKMEQWTSWELDKILSQSLVVVLPFLFATIPGILLSIPFILAVGNYLVTMGLATLSCLFLFPLLLHSTIRNQSIGQPFSGKVFASVRSSLREWWSFWGISLVCGFFVIGFGFFVLMGGGFLACLIAAGGSVFVLLCYFRLVGLQYRRLLATY